MELTKSKNHNPNYLARIIYLDDSNFSKHPNADKLKLVHYNGNIISTSIDDNPGYYLYFPVECVISSEFLSFHNLYRNSKLNTNSDKKGFFEDSGRVKCIKLRGIASEGLIMPFRVLFDFIYKDQTLDETIINNTANKYLNVSFDTVNNIKLVWKYVIKYDQDKTGNKTIKSKIIDTIVDKQFRFHITTPKLQDDINVITPNDLIQLTIKEHGTSVIFCKLMTYKKLNLFEKLLDKINISINKTEYKTFCSSRKVIKDPILNPKIGQNYYDCDIWNLALEVIKNYLISGMSIYAEIVGYLPSGKLIQAKYDYGCIYDPQKYQYNKMTAIEMYNAKLFDIKIYRITETNVDGIVHEYSSRQVYDWCNKMGLHHMYELYYGYAKDLFNIDVDDYWNENFVEKLRETYLEKDSILCNNKVPEEGIVIRREVSDIDVYKFKSNRFLQNESQELDKGTIDIESIQEQ